MEKTWRLIVDGARNPYLNMAIDEAIMLRQAGAGSVPTLRIYRWLYPCISIGRFQYLELSLRAERSSSMPLGIIRGMAGKSNYNPDCFVATAPRNDRIIVRRPTGGGAVTHNDLSFTYSVAYREDSGAISRGALNSYKEIHAGIIEALGGLGIKAGFHLSGNKDTKPAAGRECFGSPVEFDVMCGGRKIAGAAQRRKFGVVLHQGEVSLGLDVLSKWSYNNFLIAFTSGLSRHLKAEFLKSKISDIEIKLAEGLAMKEVNR